MVVKRLILLALLLLVPGTAWADDSPSQIFETDVAGYYLDMLLIGLADHCGLRPKTWVDDGKTAVLKTVFGIAENLFEDAQGKISATGTAELQKQASYLAAGFNQGETTTLEGCSNAVTDDPFGKIDKALGYNQ